MANRFILNETSYHGAGAIKSIVDEAKGRSFKKAFVCSDPDLVKFGVTKKVLDVLDGAGLPYELYSNIKPNPTIENVQTGVEAFKASGADYIIAIGGGSSNLYLTPDGKIGGLPGKAADLINKTKDNAKIERIKNALINIIGHNRISGDLGIPDFTSEFQFSNGAFSVADSGFTVDMAALDRTAYGL